MIEESEKARYKVVAETRIDWTKKPEHSFLKMKNIHTLHALFVFIVHNCFILLTIKIALCILKFYTIIDVLREV